MGEDYLHINAALNIILNYEQPKGDKPSPSIGPAQEVLDMNERKMNPTNERGLKVDPICTELPPILQKHLKEIIAGQPCSVVLPVKVALKKETLVKHQVKKEVTEEALAKNAKDKKGGDKHIAKSSRPTPSTGSTTASSAADDGTGRRSTSTVHPEAPLGAVKEELREVRKKRKRLSLGSNDEATEER